MEKAKSVHYMRLVTEVARWAEQETSMYPRQNTFGHVRSLLDLNRARQRALKNLLVSKGIITEAEYADAMLVALEEIVEAYAAEYKANLVP